MLWQCGPRAVRGNGGHCCAGAGAIILSCLMGADFYEFLPPGVAPPLPKSVVVEGADWNDVRESQERYAREFDLLLQRLDPALAQRGAKYTEETDYSLRKDIKAAQIAPGLDAETLEARIGELLRRHPDPYEQGQIMYEAARKWAPSHDGKRAERIILDAQELPLWPNQKAELHYVTGQLIFREYRLKREAEPSAEDTHFPEFRRKVVMEYLRSAKVALDCAFSRDLPDLQLPNTLERVALPQDPNQQESMMKALAERKMVEAKASKFMGLMRKTENLRAGLESEIASLYAREPLDAQELAALAAEILHDPQEEAKLMEMLKAKRDEASAP